MKTAHKHLVKAKRSLHHGSLVIAEDFLRERRLTKELCHEGLVAFIAGWDDEENHCYGVICSFCSFLFIKHSINNTVNDIGFAMFYMYSHGILRRWRSLLIYSKTPRFLDSSRGKVVDQRDERCIPADGKDNVVAS